MADKSLVMTFLNQEGARTSLTLPAVKDTITEAEVITAMDTVIAANIFYSSGGSLVTKHSAQVTERTVTELDVR
jgi:hypothetical protein